MLERIGGHFMPLVIGGTIAYARSVETVAQDFLEVKPEFAIGVPGSSRRSTTGSKPSSKGPPVEAGSLPTGTGGGLREEPEDRRGRDDPRPLGPPLHLLRRPRPIEGPQETGRAPTLLRLRGAPLAGDLARFFHCAGILICEGYGATETSAPATLNVPSAFRFGSVGKPIPGVEVKIVKDGEILVKGPNVCAGYFKDPETTGASFTEDGFYRTGDVGFFDADGFLAITDRMKELIITASGKNIAPTKLENLLKARPAISNALAHCDRRPLPRGPPDPGPARPSGGAAGTGRCADGRSAPSGPISGNRWTP